MMDGFLSSSQNAHVRQYRMREIMRRCGPCIVGWLLLYTLVAGMPSTVSTLRDTLMVITS